MSAEKLHSAHLVSESRVYAFPGRYLLVPISKTYGDIVEPHIPQLHPPSIDSSWRPLSVIAGSPPTVTVESGHMGDLEGVPSQIIYGVFGLLELGERWYLAVIQERESLGTYLGAAVFRVAKVALLPLVVPGADARPHAETEIEMKEIINLMEDRGMYFSYSMDMTNSIQRRHHYDIKDGTVSWKQVDEKFFWNMQLSQHFQAVGAEEWVLPVVYGFFSVAHDCVFNGHRFTFVLTSRRSRHRAGTRYKRRGIDDEGYVANFVETEQIIILPDDSKLAFCQVRGSLPVFWTQDNGDMRFRPRAIIERSRTESSACFVKHAKRLLHVYANLGQEEGPLVCVNLVDKQGDQHTLGVEFEEVVREFNNPLVGYTWWDFHAETRNNNYEKTEELINILRENLNTMSFYWRTPDGVAQSSQRGCIRTNCMDCLDRTNAIQMLVGQTVLRDQFSRVEKFQQEHKEAGGDAEDLLGDGCLNRTSGHKLASMLLKAQMQAKEGVPEPDEKITRSGGKGMAAALLKERHEKMADGSVTVTFATDPSGEFEMTFRKMWAENGDFIARQYAGTGAMKADFTLNGARTIQGQIADGWKSMSRFVQNQFRDKYRQAAMDIMLGETVQLKAQTEAAWIAERAVALCVSKIFRESEARKERRAIEKQKRRRSRQYSLSDIKKVDDALANSASSMPKAPDDTSSSARPHPGSYESYDEDDDDMDDDIDGDDETEDLPPTTAQKKVAALLKNADGIDEGSADNPFGEGPYDKAQRLKGSRELLVNDNDSSHSNEDHATSKASLRGANLLDHEIEILVDPADPVSLPAKTANLSNSAIVHSKDNPFAEPTPTGSKSNSPFDSGDQHNGPSPSLVVTDGPQPVPIHSPVHSPTKQDDNKRVSVDGIVHGADNPFAHPSDHPHERSAPLAPLATSPAAVTPLDVSTPQKDLRPQSPGVTSPESAIASPAPGSSDTPREGSGRPLPPLPPGVTPSSPASVASPQSPHPAVPIDTRLMTPEVTLEAPTPMSGGNNRGAFRNDPLFGPMSPADSGSGAAVAGTTAPTGSSPQPRSLLTNFDQVADGSHGALASAPTPAPAPANPLSPTLADAAQMQSPGRGRDTFREVGKESPAASSPDHDKRGPALLFDHPDPAVSPHSSPRGGGSRSITIPTGSGGETSDNESRSAGMSAPKHPGVKSLMNLKAMGSSSRLGPLAGYGGLGVDADPDDLAALAAYGGLDPDVVSATGATPSDAGSAGSIATTRQRHGSGGSHGRVLSMSPLTSPSHATEAASEAEHGIPLPGHQGVSMPSLHPRATLSVDTTLGAGAGALDDSSVGDLSSTMIPSHSDSCRSPDLSASATIPVIPRTIITEASNPSLDKAAGSPPASAPPPVSSPSGLPRVGSPETSLDAPAPRMTRQSSVTGRNSMSGEMEAINSPTSGGEEPEGPVQLPDAEEQYVNGWALLSRDTASHLDTECCVLVSDKALYEVHFHLPTESIKACEREPLERVILAEQTHVAPSLGTGRYAQRLLATSPRTASPIAARLKHPTGFRSISTRFANVLKGGDTATVATVPALKVQVQTEGKASQEERTYCPWPGQDGAWLEDLAQLLTDMGVQVFKSEKHDEKVKRSKVLDLDDQSKKKTRDKPVNQNALGRIFSSFWRK